MDGEDGWRGSENAMRGEDGQKESLGFYMNGGGEGRGKDGEERQRREREIQIKKKANLRHSLQTLKEGKNKNTQDGLAYPAIEPSSHNKACDH